MLPQTVSSQLDNTQNDPFSGIQPAYGQHHDNSFQPAAPAFNTFDNTKFTNRSAANTQYSQCGPTTTTKQKASGGGGLQHTMKKTNDVDIFLPY